MNRLHCVCNQIFCQHAYQNVFKTQSNNDEPIEHETKKLNQDISDVEVEVQCNVSDSDVGHFVTSKIVDDSVRTNLMHSHFVPYVTYNFK